MSTTIAPADDLRTLLGDNAVLTDPERMAGYLREPRKRFNRTALAVALPADVAQVQALVRWAAERRIGLVPQGGNTGLVGAQVPARGDEIVVSLARLNLIRSLDAEAGNMVAEAGVILEEAHRAAEAAGAIFPL